MALRNARSPKSKQRKQRILLMQCHCITPRHKTPRFNSFPARTSIVAIVPIDDVIRHSGLRLWGGPSARQRAVAHAGATETALSFSLFCLLMSQQTSHAYNQVPSLEHVLRLGRGFTDVRCGHGMVVVVIVVAIQVHQAGTERSHGKLVDVALQEVELQADSVSVHMARQYATNRYASCDASNSNARGCRLLNNGGHHQPSCDDAEHHWNAEPDTKTPM